MLSLLSPSWEATATELEVEQADPMLEDGGLKGPHCQEEEEDTKSKGERR